MRLTYSPTLAIVWIIVVIILANWILIRDFSFMKQRDQQDPYLMTLFSFLRHLPLTVQPLVLSPELVLCAQTEFQQCSQLIPRKPQFRFALLPGQWDDFEQWNKHNQSPASVTVKVKLPNCYLYELNGIEIFVSIIMNVGNYWRIPGERSNAIADLRILNSGFTVINPFERPVLTFEDSDLFLRQLSYNLFVPCKHRLALERMKYFPELHLRESRAKRTNSVNILSQVIGQFYKYKAYPFLMFQTLLGWYRECDLNPHSTEFHIGIHASQITPELASTILNTTFCKILSENGSNNQTGHYLYQFSLFCNSELIRVYSVYSDNENSWVGVWNMSSVQRHIWPTTMKDMCSTELLGHLLFVPCQVEDILNVEYGDNWVGVAHAPTTPPEFELQPNN